MRFDKNKIILIAVAAVLAVVLAVLVIVALGKMEDLKISQPQETTAPTQPEPAEDLTVETPYGNLTFPGQWADFVLVERTENPDLTVSFSANLSDEKVHNLFDIRFGEAVDPAVGQVVSSEGVAVGVHVKVHPFNPDGSWAVRDSEAVANMLECLDRVLAGLNMVPLGTPIPEISGEEMVIETPYCKLYFPARWKEELRLAMDETDGYDLVFHAVIGEHDAVPIFAVNFGGTEAMGTSVRSMVTENDVPFDVRVRTFGLEPEGWSKVDESTIMSMQEDLNHLLTKLMAE